MGVARRFTEIHQNRFPFAPVSLTIGFVRFGFIFVCPWLGVSMALFWFDSSCSFRYWLPICWAFLGGRVDFLDTLGQGWVLWSKFVADFWYLIALFRLNLEAGGDEVDADTFVCCLLAFLFFWGPVWPLNAYGGSQLVLLFWASGFCTPFVWVWFGQVVGLIWAVLFAFGPACLLLCG